MVRLLITNRSKFTQDFAWRLPGAPGLRSEIIPLAGRIVISDLAPHEAAAIVAHHRRYGLVEADDAHQGAGLHYSIEAAQ